MKWSWTPFLTTKRKMFDLLILLIIDVALFIIWDSIEIVTLFSFGFIWNWVASQDLTPLLEKRRYRFSMVKLVLNLQALILKPFGSLPFALQRLIACLPAGLFWCLVIYFNDSDMPWWATFVGSLTLELTLLESYYARKQESPL